MKEYVVRAIVLGVRPQRGNDKRVDLLTKEFGRLEATAVGAQKILSKFSPHLDVGNVIRVRFVKKHAITITDALSESRSAIIKENPRRFSLALELFTLLRELLPVLGPDVRIWYFVNESLKSGRVKLSLVLKLLGYDPLCASCEECGARRPSYFAFEKQSFFCVSCRGKLGGNKVVYIP